MTPKAHFKFFFLVLVCFEDVFLNFLDPSLSDIDELISTIEVKLAENEHYFMSKIAAFLSEKSELPLNDLSVITDLQTEKLKITRENLSQFKQDFGKCTAKIVALSTERNELTNAITHSKQLAMMSTILDQCQQLCAEKKFSELSKNILVRQSLFVLVFILVGGRTDAVSLYRT